MGRLFSFQERHTHTHKRSTPITLLTLLFMFCHKKTPTNFTWNFVHCTISRLGYLLPFSNYIKAGLLTKMVYKKQKGGRVIKSRWTHTKKNEQAFKTKQKKSPRKERGCYSWTKWPSWVPLTIRPCLSLLVMSVRLLAFLLQHTHTVPLV